MSSISNLLGESPFVTLIAHGEKVNECIRLLAPLFEAVLDNNLESARETADKIEQLETESDALQTRLQEQLAARALLPLDKQVLFHTAEQQDAMADRAEDIAVAATCRPLSLPPGLREDFSSYLKAIIGACDLVAGIMNRMDLLVESSFQGRDALTASKLITEVDQKEDAIKAQQAALSRQLYKSDTPLEAVDLLIWVQTLRELGRLARAADRTAGGIRLMLKGF
jgi:predicted phosphate transport protein (TIGR00153 family)